ncbi:MAG TPA: type IX secretion system outer membrane channel protein PorV [Ignavibacteriales bacterium]|nr:type IX secretion system outer membrane channel protein PorV [Ignavibacteriales bacterium]HOL80213.1 type IX secretion system outer membrane channel protein PorV [Ignavibacteriales bacterium]HOM64494.1 type IX secretion system outer membrane channel protein PorV [Ignavibacteriales bacterium]HPD66591.1 type IX secretion system outer membrane channel protein PorV [Ignavibacteriales bacterium]HPP32402.1 type IX secretion system outer membrane channel protein PorV [Ignavibacteriales bacterium]
MLKTTKLKLIAVILLTFVVKDVFSQGNTAVPFLLIAPDSKFGAMGEAGSALSDNVAGIYWNPAGIAFLTGSEVSLTHSKWLPQFNLDLYYDYLAYRTYIEDLEGSVTTSITFMNYGEFVRTSDRGDVLGTFRSYDAALTLGYSTKIDNDWGLGFNFRVIRSQLSETPTAQEKGKGVTTTASFDLGFIWRPDELVFDNVDLSKKVSLGVNISNIGPKIYYIDRDQADPIPTNLRLGAAVNLYRDEYNSVTLVADVNKLLVNAKKDTSTTQDEFYKAMFTTWGDYSISKTMREFNFGVGLQYDYVIPGEFEFALRGGYFYEDPLFGARKFLTFGGGVKYDMYRVDFSYITTSMFENRDNHPLNGTLRFTISVDWDSKDIFSNGFPKGI